ncbi:ABC transporter substrate-binding protein [Ferroplasma sp.]|uniref:ABC transporter substrate-binding protein n=1 Tax=Ferroplasma sp. TaxID=2591003 RepID=UPI00307CE330
MERSSKLIAILLALIIIASSGVYVAYKYGYHPEIKKGVELNLDSNVSGIKFNKIISLDPSVTATLYAIGSINDVDGIYSYPGLWPGNNITGNIQAVGAYPSMDVQQILNISPQAVISFSDYKQSQINELLNAGIDYIFLSSDSNTSFNIMKQQNTFLGEITGNEKNATLLNNWMNESLNIFNNLNVTNKTAFYSLCVYDGKSYTAGNNTFVSSMMKYAHLIDVANGSGFYQPSNEKITKYNPDVLILGNSFYLSDLNQTPYKTLNAVKNKIYYQEPFNNIFSEPNFRDIYGIQWMIYNVFNKNVTIPQFPINLRDSPEPGDYSENN